MACQNFTKHNRNRFVVTGISLTEMLVAVMLLSLVTGFAFTATSTMRKNHLVEARIASDRITTTEAMTALPKNLIKIRVLPEQPLLPTLSRMMFPIAGCLS